MQPIATPDQSSTSITLHVSKMPCIYIKVQPQPQLRCKSVARESTLKTKEERWWKKKESKKERRRSDVEEERGSRDGPKRKDAAHDQHMTGT